MSKLNLEHLHSLAGFVGAALVDSDSGMALVDSDSGMALGMTGGAELNLELAAAGNTEVVRAKRRIAEQLGLNDTIEDILITLARQYHLLRPLESNSTLFLYVVLDRAKANLAMARHELKAFEKTLDFG
ncbi:roadblock/LC7 domain-containing protein [Xanthomonas citri pv. mangiferaeindicae]|uniref:roadblock/LC7 domain-containing protein n=2 Tax=Xanthomonas TaxID=338 RepID=UPI001CFD4E6A|nr:roadblock/LC7 domain-containing protein [Xanthomonas citri]UDB87796.1 roadblock/LC7 domain-containing protein [Xanthomonas citri pv. mangiferaeindicae]